MIELSILVILLGILFYLEEWSSESPSVVRAGVYAIAIVEGILCLSFTA